ncbi:MAG: AI-2E family transporter [Catenibacillus sp.]|nr:AI-2E family transporter [Catenibacillus sp.]
MNLSKENMKKMALLIVMAILVYNGVKHIDVVLDCIIKLLGLVFPFIIGGCVAFVLNVPMSAIERHVFERYHGKHQKLVSKIKRPLSFFMAVILVVGVIILVAVFITPQLGETIGAIINQIPKFFNDVQVWINQLMNEYKWVADQLGQLEIDWNSLSKSLISFLQTSIGSAFSSTMGFAFALINGVVTFFLGFVFAVYVLFQKEKLSVQVKKMMYAYLKESHADRIIEVLHMTHRTFSRFLSGQCCEAVILGTLFFVTLTIFKMPYALLISVVIAFLSLIPIVGAFMGCFIGALLILMVNPWEAIAFVVIFLVIQQIEGNLIYPRVVGSSIGLPAIWVLVAVTVGGSAFGIAGMLVFIPLTSVVYSLLREWMYKRLSDRHIPKEKFEKRSNKKRR